MEIEHYRPSGKMTGLSVPMMVLSGVATGIGCAVVYQWLVDLIPFVYFNIFLAMAFGGGVGLAVGWAAHRSKCRAPMPAISVAVCCAAIGIAVSFVTAYERWVRDTHDTAIEFQQSLPEEIDGLLRELETFSLFAETAENASLAREAKELIGDRRDGQAYFDFLELMKSSSPEIYEELTANGYTMDDFRSELFTKSITETRQHYTFGRYVEKRAAGGWTVGSGSLPLSGPFVYIIWLIEFAVVAGFAGIAAWFDTTRRPFSESTQSWARETALGSIDGINRPALKAALSENVRDVLFDPPRVKRGRTRAKYGLWTVEGGDEMWLDVTLEAVAKEKGKTDDSKIEAVAKAVVVSSEEVAALKKRLST